MKNNIKIVAVMGKSGSGKSTIVDKICKDFPNQFHKIVHTTTRPPRDEEVDGKDYHFTTYMDFTQKIVNDKFISAVNFNDWCYGTELDKLNKQKINIGVFSPEETEIIQFEIGNKNVLPIYLIRKDKDRLIDSLRREEEPNIDEIVRRYLADKRDFSDISDLNPIIIKNVDSQLVLAEMSIYSHALMYDWA